MSAAGVDVCTIDCTNCPRTACCGAAALARECRADAAEGTVNTAEAEAAKNKVMGER